MKYSVDFSIYSSPTKAYGNATGELDFVITPLVGQVIELVDGKKVKIISISSGFDGYAGCIVGLDDIVFTSIDAARALARQLESELNLFVVPYHED